MKRTEYSFSKIDFNGSRAVMPLSIRDERSSKDGIIDLLLIQWLACDIDGLEPFQFLAGITLTYIDGQRIVQNLTLNILGLIEEVLKLVG